MRPNQIIVRRLFGIAFVLSAAALFEVDALAQTDDDFVNIWHVDADDGNDMASGSSWNTALQTVERALEKARATIAESDLIKVAQGTYEPEFQTNPPDVRSATISPSKSCLCLWVRFASLLRRRSHAFPLFGQPFAPIG